MKPIIKYRGGKYREIKYFEEFIPEGFDTYIEPFVGGGAVFFYLEPRKSIINDINQRLIEFYRELRDSYEVLRAQLDELQTTYENNQKEYEAAKSKAGETTYVENKNEKLYYQIRDIYNNPNGKWLNATTYYFINKTSYSGMIRHNSNGDYNVPFGRYKHFNAKVITDEHNRLLRRTKICNEDFAAIFDMAKPSDFMFLDPPYHMASFNDYGNTQYINGFSEDEHKRLAKKYKQLCCKALMVISKTNLTEELYKEYIAGEYGKEYMVNIRNRFRASAQHIIVKNY